MIFLPHTFMILSSIVETLIWKTMKQTCFLQLYSNICHFADHLSQACYGASTFLILITFTWWWDKVVLFDSYILSRYSGVAALSTIFFLRVICADIFLQVMATFAAIAALYGLLLILLGFLPHMDSLELFCRSWSVKEGDKAWKLNINPNKTWFTK